MAQIEEVWKDIDGYEGLYQVSNLGNVKNVRSNRILVQQKNRYGYPVVGISKLNKKKLATIHRLVAIAFIPNPQNKKEVNHIDGDTGNSKLSNLEWVTPSENQAHSYKSGKRKRYVPIKNTLTGCIYFNIKECAKENNINYSSLRKKLGKSGVNDTVFIKVDKQSILNAKLFNNE